jgi:hypothetical protein
MWTGHLKRKDLWQNCLAKKHSAPNISCVCADHRERLIAEGNYRTAAERLLLFYWNVKGK